MTKILKELHILRLIPVASMVGKIIALVSFATVLSACAMSPPAFDERAWREKVLAADPALLYAPHYKDGRYFNPWMPMEEKGFWRFLRWKLSSKEDYSDEERSYLPEVVPGPRERILSLGEEDFIMWVGHATFLIRVNGKYWLTDPMFSQRALLPKRKVPPALSLEDLNKITDSVNVVISHNHYDHLDKATIRGLPDKTRFFVPLGLKEFINELGRGDVTEMDWWQTVDPGGDTTLVCLPMQHWSRRIGQGLNETLWASFLLITPKAKIYFGGDTGYFVGFREIGRKFPGIDYALLPLTAYHPRWFMHYAHMDADETIAAFHDLGARYMIPQQWGTFHLGNNPPGFPILDLKKRLEGKNPDRSRILILRPGEIRPIVPAPPGS